jgi:integrase
LPAYLPTSAVEFNSERPSQKALPFKGFPAWLKVWRKIDNAVRQAYHMAGLLIGARPGELARLRWNAYSDNERILVIAKAKAGNDITIPVTDEIAAVLRMARAGA